jgi:hypothetical protein
MVLFLLPPVFFRLKAEATRQKPVAACFLPPEGGSYEAETRGFRL